MASATNNIVVIEPCSGVESVSTDQNNQDEYYLYGEELNF